MGERTITNMKIQKLVYLAESAFGATFGVDLIDEEFQAWNHGPAVKPLYGQFKTSRDAPIPHPVSQTPELPENIHDILETVWENFGSMTASQLRALTHEIGPYDAHYLPGVRDIVLPKNEVHDVWNELLSEALDKKSRTDRTTEGFWALLGRAPASEVGQVDTLQLMQDYTTFSVR